MKSFVLWICFLVFFKLFFRFLQMKLLGHSACAIETLVMMNLKHGIKSLWRPV